MAASQSHYYKSTGYWTLSDRLIYDNSFILQLFIVSVSKDKQEVAGLNMNLTRLVKLVPWSPESQESPDQRLLLLLTFLSDILLTTEMKHFIFQSSEVTITEHLLDDGRHEEGEGDEGGGQEDEGEGGAGDHDAGGPGWSLFLQSDQEIRKR